VLDEQNAPLARRHEKIARTGKRAEYPDPVNLPTDIGEMQAIDATPETLGSREACAFAAEQERLIIEHLPVVRVVARRIYRLLPEHVSFGELYGAGVRGLIRASKHFEPSKHADFSGYAKLQIREAIIDGLRGLVWSAEELRRKGKPVEEAIRTLSAELSRSPNELEISQELYIDLAAYHRLLGELKGI
jgi:RNA polymerase sigma factor for flagellar operon FliA